MPWKLLYIDDLLLMTEREYKSLLWDVGGDRMRGRPRKTWMEVIKCDLRRLSVPRKAAQGRILWRKIIR